LLKTGFPMDMIDSRLVSAKRKAQSADAAVLPPPVDSPRPARRPR
jgi:hypothetical protein